MQESEIIKGCRMPSVIEIMEASLIVEPGTLGKLNRLLDDSRKLDLLYGEVVETTSKCNYHHHYQSELCCK